MNTCISSVIDLDGLDALAASTPAAAIADEDRLILQALARGTSPQMVATTFDLDLCFVLRIASAAGAR
jgi:hypothetical protein